MSEQMMTIEEIRAEIAELEQALKDKKAELRELRPVKAKATPRECECGCGGWTQGGLFQPGHDAKLRSRLLARIDDGDDEALTLLLVDYPSLLHGASESDLRARLGSEQRKKDAAVARQVERDAAKASKPKSKSAKPRIDPVEAQQGTKSPTLTRNAAAIKLAKTRAA